jgi:diguanylate cyclase (GGDEF)-like protein
MGVKLTNPLDLIVVDRKRLWDEMQRDETSPLSIATLRSRLSTDLVRKLLDAMRRLAPMLPELDTAGFRASLKEAGQQISATQDPAELDDMSEQLSRRIRKYADEQERLLSDREQELRRIVDLVSQSLRQQRTGARALVDGIRQSADHMDEVAKLEDLRQVRAALVRNAEALRSAAARAVADDAAGGALDELEKLRLRLTVVEEAATRDPLTGAGNRRAYDERLRQLLETGEAFILVLCDVDGLKRVNDSHGHAVGDRYLKQAATQLRAVFRPTDLVTRIGGDEYSILVPGLEPYQAAARLQAVFPRRAARRESAADLSLSFGIAAHEAGDTPEELFERADRRLYEAKRAPERVVYR